VADSPDLKSLQKVLDTVLRPFVALLKVQPSNPKAMEQLAEALRPVPSGAAVAEPIDAAVAALRQYVDEHRSTRESGFRRIEAAFISSVRERVGSVKELESGWRVGFTELTVDRPQGRASVLYNGEIVIPWRPIQSDTDLAKLIDEAEKKLIAAELPHDQLRALMNAAYAEARRTTSSGRVPMPDFFRAFRLALVQDDLKSGKPEKKLRHAEFPRWVFLYNIDRYRERASELASDRLDFEPGSQADNAKGLGMVVNGLARDGVHKKVCYVVRSSEVR
jgi:hypothetical protein